MQQYDAIIIGAGQAGPGVAATLAGEGQRVALAEGDKLGGTCLNYGCRPTKALRKSAEVAHIARGAAAYGVNTGPVEVDFAAVMRRMRGIIGEMQASVKAYMENVEHLDLYRDYARFTGTEGGLHHVEVGGQVIAAPEVYINTGARAFVPPIEGIHDVPHLTNVELLALDDLPRHLIVIGGSYIGLEFGQMFRRFGSEVSIIETSAHVASREDADVAAHIEDFLREEGVALHTHHRAVKVAAVAGGVQVTIRHNDTGAETTLSGSHLLVATGRQPNTDSLNLEAVGVQTDKRGYILTDGHFQTNVPGIWALGDVNGRGAFTHTSYQDYEILMAHRRGEDRSADGRIMAYAMFTDPPLGRVGMSEREAQASGRNVLVARYPMAKVSRARLDSTTRGLIKVLVDADTEQIIGGLTLGMHGDDLIQVISNFMTTGASYKLMRDALPIHPTVGEFFPTILAGLEPLG